MVFVRGLLAAVWLVFAIPCVDAATFTFDVVIDQARALAKQPYQALAQVPQFLRDLEYRQYQEIRFKPEASLWRGSKSKFQVMMMSPGTYYSQPVTLHEVDSDGVHTIAFDKSNFDYPNESLAKRIPADTGYAGFKLTYPMHDDTTQNQFLVFAGASYFRGVGRDNHFGLSARGIAVDTGLPSGEEYPMFVEYWIERPAAGADVMTVYGLLDGPSVTGAYRFQIHPGESTRVEVTAQVFLREDIQLLGFAPLTSMFYYGENTPRPVGEWRPQVHDSDGLLIHDGRSGEWLWRPLINPRKLRMSFLEVENLRGFGLLQRNSEFSQFEDAEARYDARPSAWVEPKGVWGKGQIVLVEIPTRSETHDNIVAFWHPAEPTLAGQQLSREYTLRFGSATLPGQPSAAAQQTFVGDGNRVGGGAVEGAYRVIVDFAGGKLAGLGPGASVVSSVTGGERVEVLEHFVEYIAPEKYWRLSMLVRPAADAILSLRAFLSLDGQPLTETWTYELPPQAGVRGAMN
ncbi:glucan biosynthesis protein G [Marinobacter caseinilyticus]|uniref:glucan biosynthesis protein G n=1 Tax=Marinobacter caseinilyticus TaxID=2692195 RepID=UPI00140C26CE|nr:glucan biosynthesis protein G [Marinobacter caseinilyticus]